jgi:hypothetical protein
MTSSKKGIGIQRRPTIPHGQSPFTVPIDQVQLTSSTNTDLPIQETTLVLNITSRISNANSMMMVVFVRF